MSEDDKTIVVVAIIIFLIGVPIVWAVLPAPLPVTDETLDVWDAQAPFGHYWVSTQGEGSIFHFEMWSNLVESYTIKFMQNGELKTAIFPSTGSVYTGTTDRGQQYTTDIIPHVYLVDQNITPTLRIVLQFDHRNFGFMNEGQPLRVDYYLTLPDPKVFG